ncbi:MAG: tRNA lysidine(34) synthetase TilS [Spirochaetota bacterium]
MILATLRDWLQLRSREAPNSRIVVAVSGGVDSVALATGLAAVAGETGIAPSSLLIFAHFNHRLRHEVEHAHDLAVVSKLARGCGVPLVIDSARAGAIEAGAPAAGGVESAARAARYRFFGDVCRAGGARTVCTAHHADDQVETVLMRLLAGQTGSQLAGIPGRRELGAGVLLCRPLLTTGRAEIEAFAAERNLLWSVDRSNIDPRYRRNRVRTEVLPPIEGEWPAVRHDLLTLASSMEAVRLEARRDAASVAITWLGDSARVSRREFYALGFEARLELAYDTIRRLDLLRREDRPGHRFFEPLRGADPGRDHQLIASRGIRVRLEAESLVFEPDIVRPTERRYLRQRSRER